MTDTLPDDLLREIFSYMIILKDLKAFRLTCKSFHTATSRCDALVWIPRIQREFPQAWDNYKIYTASAVNRTVTHGTAASVVNSGNALATALATGSCRNTMNGHSASAPITDSRRNAAFPFKLYKSFILSLRKLRKESQNGRGLHIHPSIQIDPYEKYELLNYLELLADDDSSEYIGFRNINIYIYEFRLKNAILSDHSIGVNYHYTRYRQYLQTEFPDENPDNVMMKFADLHINKTIVEWLHSYINVPFNMLNFLNSPFNEIFIYNLFSLLKYYLQNVQIEILRERAVEIYHLLISLDLPKKSILTQFDILFKQTGIQITEIDLLDFIGAYPFEYNKNLLDWVHKNDFLQDQEIVDAFAQYDLETMQSIVAFGFKFSSEALPKGLSTDNIEILNFIMQNNMDEMNLATLKGIVNSYRKKVDFLQSKAWLIMQWLKLLNIPKEKIDIDFVSTLFANFKLTKNERAEVLNLINQHF